MSDLDPAQLAERLEAAIGESVVGQREAVRQLMVALVAGGHVLLEGVPGVAKTLLAKTLARRLQLDYGRVQFTPDLMPSDITGTSIFRPDQGHFVLSKGPIFTEVLLADEINRTPPKTQSALLEAMEERQLTLEGKRHPLGPYFFVIATQNPLEFEGTYPLPEAQTDRFLFKIVMDYPEEAEETEVLRRHHDGFDPHDMERLEPVAGKAELDAIRARADGLTVDDSVLTYIVNLVRASRRSAELRLGASPRASVYLLAAARAHAALAGQDFVTPDDVKAVALPTLRHRLVLGAEAEVEGVTVDGVVERLLSSVEVPR